MSVTIGDLSTTICYLLLRISDNIYKQISGGAITFEFLGQIRDIAKDVSVAISEGVLSSTIVNIACKYEGFCRDINISGDLMILTKMFTSSPIELTIKEQNRIRRLVE